MPRLERCQRSWWSISLTATLNRWRRRSFRLRTTKRLSLREALPGRCSSIARAPTTMRRLQRAGHFLDPVDLQDVADLDVVEVGDPDPALEAARHLANVVLEPPQGPDRAVVDHHLVADDADLGVARHRPLGHVAPGDDSDLRDAERVAHFHHAVHVLALLGLQHAFERLLHRLDGFVDDLVELDVDALALGDLARARRRPDMEPQNDGIRGGGQLDVGVVDAADALVDDAHRNFLVRELLERFRQRLHRAVDVGLENEPELLELSLLDLLVELFEGDAGRRLGFPGALVLLAPGGDLARFTLFDDHRHRVAGLRHAVGAEHLHRRSRQDLVDAPAALVEQRPHPSREPAGDEHVSGAQGALLHQDRRYGAVLGALLRLQDDALGAAGTRRAQLEQIGLKVDHLEQLLDAFAGLGRNLAGDD